MSESIHFLLNDQDVHTQTAPGLLVLDYLRRHQHLMGTKEGCKEGDCGACVILVGELAGDQVRYQPVTSCLAPVGELHGKHLVTVEGLNLESLSPVQDAIVEEGGSQCGFCTPGIVVSLTAYLLHAGETVDADGIKYALSGNLCRCTGYASLKRAGDRLVQQFGNGSKNGKNSGNGAFSQTIETLVQKQAIPAYFRDIPERLKSISPPLAQNSKDVQFTVAGGTDLYVQQGEKLPDAQVQVLNLHPEMKQIQVEEDGVHVGALVTFEEFGVHPEINRIIPEIQIYNHYNASWQIRNRATLGGNIVNASPIGDMTALLLALESKLVLRAGKKERTVEMKRFFKGYKTLDKQFDEILTEIIFPQPEAGTKINFEKVSKRKTLDIASVNSAIRIRCEDGVIADIQLSMGGVAPIPLFMQQTCDFLTGQLVTAATISGAMPVAMSEISPISDIRGSADYKRLLVRQFIVAHFTKLFPESVSVRDFYETH